MTIDTLLHRIRAEYSRLRISKRSLAIQAGLHPNTLMRIDRDDWSPSVETIRRLESLLLTSGDGK